MNLGPNIAIILFEICGHPSDEYQSPRDGLPLSRGLSHKIEMHLNHAVYPFHILSFYFRVELALDILQVLNN